jgi:subtilisin family serine protease
MNLPAGVTAGVHRVPRPGRRVVVGARPIRCGVVADLRDRGRVARINSCRRGEGWASRTCNGSIGARRADKRRCDVLHRDGLGARPAGVTASVCGDPGPGLGVSAGTGTILGRVRANLRDRCAIARITGCRSGERRASRAIYRSIGTRLADKRRRDVLHRDGLGARPTGVTASVCGNPGPGLGVSAGTSPIHCAVLAHLCDRGAIARIRCCRRGEGRAGRAIYRSISTRLADKWRCNVLHRDGLGARPAGVTASVCGNPGPGLGVSPGTGSILGRVRANLRDRCRVARIRCCRRGERR